MAFEIKQGDKRPHFRVQLTANGAPVNISSATGVLFYLRYGANLVISGGAMTIIDAATGVVEYVWQGADTALAGDFSAEVKVNWGAESQTFPSQGYFDVTISPSLSQPVTGLITLDDYRVVQGIAPSYTTTDDKISALIPYASAAVRAYAQRDFGAALVTETRDYNYDGSGFLDIDDAASITALSVVYGTSAITLDTESWTAKPGPVFYYIELPGYMGQIVGSPEMGFTRNLDVYARDRGMWALPPKVSVAATFGWPFVPDDVKLAVIWTVQSWMERPSGELTSEAIEGWSRSWSRNGQAAAALAIPERARDLLAAYARESA